MTVEYVPRAVDALEAAPAAVQKAFLKQVRLLAENSRHPSLRVKKYDPERGIWQARINRDWRLYFQIHSDTYLILDIISHPK